MCYRRTITRGDGVTTSDRRTRAVPGVCVNMTIARRATDATGGAFARAHAVYAERPVERARRQCRSAAVFYFHWAAAAAGRPRQCVSQLGVFRTFSRFLKLENV